MAAGAQPRRTAAPRDPTPHPGPPSSAPQWPLPGPPSPGPSLPTPPDKHATGSVLAFIRPQDTRRRSRPFGPCPSSRLRQLLAGQWLGLGTHCPRVPPPLAQLQIGGDPQGSCPQRGPQRKVGGPESTSRPVPCPLPQAGGEGAAPGSFRQESCGKGAILSGPMASGRVEGSGGRQAWPQAELENPWRPLLAQLQTRSCGWAPSEGVSGGDQRRRQGNARVGLTWHQRSGL